MFTGELKCWGHNEFGDVLGIGAPGNRGDNPGEMGAALPAIDLGTGRTATAISVGRLHTCALLDNGRSSAGADTGELGCGDTENRGDEPGEMGDALPAVDLGTGRTATAIVAGEDHTCALLDNGQVKCWGGNASASSASATPTTAATSRARWATPSPPSTSAPGAPPPPSAPRLEHTCALLDNGQVKCWGVNDDGQLGLGDTDEPRRRARRDGRRPPRRRPRHRRTATAIATGSESHLRLLDDAR